MKQLIKDMMAEAKHDFKSMHASARPTSKRGSTQIIAEQAKLDTHFWYDLYHDLLTMSDDSVMDEACDDPRTALLLRLRCLLYAKHYEGTEAIQTLPAAIDAYANLEAARTGVTVPSDASHKWRISRSVVTSAEMSEPEAEGTESSIKSKKATGA